MRLLKELQDLAYSTIAGKGTYTNQIYSVEKSRKDLVFSVLRYSGNIFLDVGCGQGIYIKEMRPHYKLLIGIDFCKSALLDIKKELRTVKNIELIMADAHYLPLRRETIDIVLCSEVLEHTKDPQLVIDQIVETSRKYVLITVPIEARQKNEDIVDLARTDMNTLRNQLQKNLEKTKTTHIHKFSFHSFKNMLDSENCLEIAECRSASFTFIGSGSLRRIVAKWKPLEQLWKFIEIKILSRILIFRVNFRVIGGEFCVFLLKRRLYDGE